MFSRATEYAIRALTFLARQPPGKLTGAREISEAEQIPMPFLWKILQNLTRRKLVRSYKGLRGGYELARPAEEIRLDVILMATDGAVVTENCVLGLPECNEQNPCPLHNSWKAIRSKLTVMFEQTTLADLARATKRRKRRKRA